MFGGLCWLLNGNMICGVEVGRFMFRVGKALESKALSRPGAEPVVFSGRKMGGIVWVDADATLETGLDAPMCFATVAGNPMVRPDARPPSSPS